jgi:hypothetical protein
MRRLFCGAVLFSLILAAPFESVGQAADPVALWGRFETRLKGAQGTAEDTRVTVEFTSPSGKKRNIEGFWDGGAEWGIRLMADEEGTWRYVVRSAPKAEGLDGASGSFDCRAEKDSKNRFLRHGVLRVAESGTYLEHADGTPFFWLGDTVWTGPAFATLEDWKTYLSDRAAKKFSVIQYNIVCPWRTAPTDREGNRAFEGDKNVRINPKFYQRLDRFMDAINGEGFAASPILMWALGQKDPGNFLPEEDIEKIIRYEVARYGAHHVVWLLAGDNRYDPRSTEKWKRIGRKVFGSGLHQPVSTHPTGMNWPWESWRDEKWLTVFGYQSGHGDDANTLAWIHSGPIAKNWQNKPVRPIINLEPPYEDHLGYQSRKPHSAYNVRRAVYWSLLNAPTAGVTYGGHGLWSWQTEPGKTPPDHGGTGVAKMWHEALDLPGGVQMKHMATLLESLEWWKLRPNQKLLAKQPADGDALRFVAAASTEAGDAAVLYLPVGGEVAVDAKPLNDATKAEWFNPRDGKRQAAESSGGKYRAPDGQDWVLVLRR